MSYTITNEPKHPYAPGWKVQGPNGIVHGLGMSRRDAHQLVRRLQAQDRLRMPVCRNCGARLERDTDGTWCDAGTAGPVRLVYCADQDETHDGARHEVG